MIYSYIMSQEHVSPYSVMTSDRTRIVFDLYRHGRGSGTVLVICPGFLQNKGTGIFQRLCRDLARDQDVICVDFRGHGRSGGLYTFSAREGEDLEAVLRWARDRYKRIRLIGFSLGAAVSINTVRRFSGQVEKLVAVSAPARFEDIELRVWTPGVFMEGAQVWDFKMGCRPSYPWFKKEKPIENIHRLGSLPVLLIHGSDDWVISHRHSRRLFARAKKPKQLEIVKRGGHAEEIYRRHPEWFLSVVRRWFSE